MLNTVPEGILCGYRWSTEAAAALLMCCSLKLIALLLSICVVIFCASVRGANLIHHVYE